MNKSTNNSLNQVSVPTLNETSKTAGAAKTDGFRLIAEPKDLVAETEQKGIFLKESEAALLLNYLDLHDYALYVDGMHQLYKHDIAEDESDTASMVRCSVLDIAELCSERSYMLQGSVSDDEALDCKKDEAIFDGIISRIHSRQDNGQTFINDGLTKMATLTYHENSDESCSAQTDIFHSVKEATEKMRNEYMTMLSSFGIENADKDGESGRDGDPDYRSWYCDEESASFVDGYDDYTWEITESAESIYAKELFVVSGVICTDSGNMEIIQPVLVSGMESARQVMADTINAIASNPAYNGSKGIKRDINIAETHAELCMKGGLGGAYHSTLKAQLAIHELIPGKQTIPCGTVKVL